MKNKFFFFVIIVLLQLVSCFRIEKIFRSNPFPVSVADYVVTSGENWNAGLILGNLLLFILLHTIKDDIRNEVVLRYSSSIQIAKKQVKMLLLIAVEISLLSMFSVFLYGWLKQIEWNNWNYNNSYFRISYGTPVRSIHLLEIVLNQILTETVIFMVVGLFGMIVLWMNRRALYAFLVLNVMWAVELCLGARIFHNLLRVRQEMWVHPIWFPIRVGYAIVLLGIEILVLRGLVRNREYIGARGR